MGPSSVLLTPSHEDGGSTGHLEAPGTTPARGCDLKESFSPFWDPFLEGDRHRHTARASCLLRRGRPPFPTSSPTWQVPPTPHSPHSCPLTQESERPGLSQREKTGGAGLRAFPALGSGGVPTMRAMPGIHRFPSIFGSECHCFLR